MKKCSFQKEGLQKNILFNSRLLKNLMLGFIMILFLLPHFSQAQDKVKGKNFIIEPPTLENLGFEWYIDGDENRNATVKVEYRLVESSKEWKRECLCLGLVANT